MLIFQEVNGPQTGNPADADIRHRCAVRLTSVAGKIPGTHLSIRSPTKSDSTFTIITLPRRPVRPSPKFNGRTDDALPFPVCISSTYLDENSDQQTVTNVSVVLGNVVLADNGLTSRASPWARCPRPPSTTRPSSTADRCQPTPPSPVPVRFQPQVPESPLTQAVPVTVVPLPAVGNPVTPDGQLPRHSAW